MKNLTAIIIAGLTILMIPYLSYSQQAEKKFPKVQASTNGDVKVSYYEDVKSVYESSKYGIAFEVRDPEYSLLAREFADEESPRALTRSGSSHIVNILIKPRNKRNRRFRIDLRFKESQYSEGEMVEWVESTIGGFRSARKYGMPERNNESKIIVDGVEVTRADYVWPRGSVNLVATFRTSKGTFFFYSRSASYKNLEDLLNTLKFVK